MRGEWLKGLRGAIKEIETMQKEKQKLLAFADKFRADRDLLVDEVRKLRDETDRLTNEVNHLRAENARLRAERNNSRELREALGYHYVGEGDIDDKTRIDRR